MAIKFGVWNNQGTFVFLGQSKFELSSAHEKIGVWNGSKGTYIDLSKWNDFGIMLRDIQWSCDSLLISLLSFHLA